MNRQILERLANKIIAAAKKQLRIGSGSFTGRFDGVTHIVIRLTVQPLSLSYLSEISGRETAGNIRCREVISVPLISER